MWPYVALAGGSGTGTSTFTLLYYHYIQECKIFNIWKHWELSTLFQFAQTIEFLIIQKNSVECIGSNLPCCKGLSNHLQCTCQWLLCVAREVLGLNKMAPAVT